MITKEHKNRLTSHSIYLLGMAVVDKIHDWYHDEGVNADSIAEHPENLVKLLNAMVRQLEYVKSEADAYVKQQKAYEHYLEQTKK